MILICHLHILLTVLGCLAYMVKSLKFTCVKIVHDFWEHMIGNIVNGYCSFAAHHVCGRLLETTAHHSAEFLRKLANNNFMSVVRFTFNFEDDIREFWIVCLISNQWGKLVLRGQLPVPLGTWICIKLIHIFQVVLSIATTNYIKWGADIRHAVSRTHFGFLHVVCEMIAMGPGAYFGIESVQIVKALCMRTTTAKKIQFRTHCA